MTQRPRKPRPPAWLRPRWWRLAGWIPVGGAVIALAWLLCTEAGLRAAVRIAHRLTHGALSVESARGALAYEFTLDGVRYDIPSVTVEIGRADLSLRLLPLLAGRVQAATLRVQGLRVQTHETASAGPRQKLSVTMPLGLAVEDGRVEALHIQIGEAGWRWTLPSAEFAARWRGKWIVMGEVRAQTNEADVVTTRGRIAIEDDLLVIEDTEVRNRGGVAHVAGAVALHEGAANDLAVDWRDARWIRDGELDWLRSPRGAATMKGPWSDYAWTLRGAVQAFDIAAETRAAGRGSLEALALRDFAVRALGGEVTGNGRIEWAPLLTTAFTIAWSGLDPSARFSEWPGRLNGRGHFEAAFPKEGPRIDFDGALADSTLRGFPLGLQASGRTEGGALFLKTLAAQSGASRVSARGQLLPKFALDGELSSSDLRSLWAGLSGSGVLSAQLRGTRAAPQLAVRGGLDDLGYTRFRAGHVAIDARVAPQGESSVAIDLSDVRAGAALKDVALRAQGTQANHFATLSAHSNDGSAELRLEGGVRGAGWRGALAQLHVVPAKGEDWQLEDPAALSVARGTLDLEPACVRSGTSRACARLLLKPGDVYVAFRTRSFDLAHLKPWLPGGLTVAGTLTGTAALEMVNGEIADLSADLAGSAGAISAGGSTLAYGPGELRIGADDEAQKGRLHATVRLTPAGGEMSGELWVAPGASLSDRPMLGDIKVRLPDLGWLPVLSPEIGGAQGSVDAALQVSGTPRSPKLDGKLQVTDGRIQLVTPGIELTHIAASFSREKSSALALHAEAESGGGKLVVDGALKQLQPDVLGEVTFKGQDVQGFNTTEFRAWLSPDLKLTLAQGLARLSGTLTVPRAEITPRDISSSGIGPSADQVIVVDGAARAPLLRIETQVRIALGDNVRFDGLGLKTRLTGAITAIDDPERPTRGVGELQLVGGRYKAYGQDLTIETGRLIFNGGPVTDPAVDLTAYRKPTEALKVGLHARGTLEAPEFSLFSEPTMSQEETLSWLVLGRSLSGTLDSSQQTQLSGAALSLGLTGGDYLAQQLAPRLGLDEVSLGAKPGDTADLARFTVGKYLSPKLFVSYGVGLFTPGHFFRMQYDLGKHFKLQGESGTTQSGDLLYTIEK